MKINPSEGYRLVSKINEPSNVPGLYVPTDVNVVGSLVKYNLFGDDVYLFAYTKPQNLLKLPTDDGTDLYAVKLEDIVAYSRE